MGSKKRQSVYAKKQVQGTYYITRVASQKLRAAMARAGRPGRKVSASDVINFCLETSADQFDRQAAAAASVVEAAIKTLRPEDLRGGDVDPGTL